MQVFLPEQDFSDAARVLDQKRLVKQLLEGRQIMTILVGENKTKAWTNHPAVRMFGGHHSALYSYLSSVRDEMEVRGYKWENNWTEISRMMSSNPQSFSLPRWMEDEYTLNSVITTHRGRLYEKAPELYGQYEQEYNVYRNYVCCERCTYFWPVESHGYTGIINA